MPTLCLAWTNLKGQNIIYGICLWYISFSHSKNISVLLLFTSTSIYFLTLITFWRSLFFNTYFLKAELQEESGTDTQFSNSWFRYQMTETIGLGLTQARYQKSHPRSQMCVGPKSLSHSPLISDIPVASWIQFLLVLLWDASITGCIPTCQTTALESSLF